MRLAPLALLGLGCAEGNDEHLSRLTRAWAVETAEAATPSVTSTTLMGALSAALCVQRSDEAFQALEPGDSLPLNAALQAALGAPVIEEMSVDSALRVVVSGIDLLDRSDEWLRITGTDDGGQYSIEVDALIDDGSDSVEVAKLVAFGQLRLDLDQGCTEAQTLIRGRALWIDSSGHRSDVQLPADSELGGDLSFGGDIPYLPNAGALGWAARIEGQERSITTEDAVEIRVDTPDDAVPVARWPVVARGPGWSGTAFTALSP